jgi:RNA recognition motif-containing protein
MSNRLYIGNLPYTFDEGALTQAFMDFGIEVQNVRVIRDRESGQSKGFAFADVIDDEKYEEALQTMNGAKVGGRPLRIDRATEQSRGGSGGGGGGRHSGGGFSPRREHDDGERRRRR